MSHSKSFKESTTDEFLLIKCYMCGKLFEPATLSLANLTAYQRTVLYNTFWYCQACVDYIHAPSEELVNIWGQWKLTPRAREEAGKPEGASRVLEVMGGAGCYGMGGVEVGESSGASAALDEDLGRNKRMKKEDANRKKTEEKEEKEKK